MNETFYSIWPLRCLLQPVIDNEVMSKGVATGKYSPNCSSLLEL